MGKTAKTIRHGKGKGKLVQKGNMRENTLKRHEKEPCLCHYRENRKRLFFLEAFYDLCMSEE